MKAAAASRCSARHWGPGDESAGSQKSVAEDVMPAKPYTEMDLFGSLAFEYIHTIRRHSMHEFANYNFKSLMLLVHASTPSYSRGVSVGVWSTKNFTASLTLHPKRLKCILFVLKLHFCLKRVDRDVCKV